MAGSALEPCSTFDRALVARARGRRGRRQGDGLLDEEVPARCGCPRRADDGAEAPGDLASVRDGEATRGEVGAQVPLGGAADGARGGDPAGVAGGSPGQQDADPGLAAAERAGELRQDGADARERSAGPDGLDRVGSLGGTRAGDVIGRQRDQRLGGGRLARLRRGRGREEQAAADAASTAAAPRPKPGV